MREGERTWVKPWHCEEATGWGRWLLQAQFWFEDQSQERFKDDWIICHLLLLYLSLSMIWYFLWNELAKHGDAIASHLKLLITDWPTRIDRGTCKVMLSPLKSFFYNLQVVFRVQWLSYLLASYTWLPSHTTVDTYRVVFLTGPSKIFLSIRLHSKSNQKSSKCLNLLTGWHLEKSC